MRVHFISDKIVEDANEGDTILDISRTNSIAHIHACGGKARCSTCRVIVLEGLGNLDPRTEKEDLLAKAKGFEPNIRLACQARVFGDVVLRRLVIDSEDIEVAVQEKSVTSGKDAQLCILFSDIRGYTQFSGKSLPYDTIHILNRYFRKMGDHVLKNYGYIDKYMGDGLMAVFGLSEGREEFSCLDAVRCALGMIQSMAEINTYLIKNFSTEFEIGIGIHFGQAVVGNIGHPAKMQFTVIGDSVNIASRIESANKDAGTNFLISSQVKEKLGDYVQIGKTFITTLKGKEGSFVLHEVKSIKENLSHTELLREFLFQNLQITDTPQILRMAFHDACSFDPKTHQGGLRAGILQERFLSSPDHISLLGIGQKILHLQKEFTKNFQAEISLADFLAHAATICLEKAGGPRVEAKFGRIDLFSESIRFSIPTEKQKFSEVAELFTKMGFTKRDMTALLGTHTLGKANGKYFTSDPYTFNNSYFLRLASATEIQNKELILLATDIMLLEDEQTRKYVIQYSKEEIKFFKDYSVAFLKLLSLGSENLRDKL